MKIYLFIIFFVLVGCTSKSSQIYICGDHLCADKKEMRDYFKNNISIEVYTITSDKEKKENLDLVDLNLLKEDLKKKQKINKSLARSKNKENIKKIIKERKKLAQLKIKKKEKSLEKPKKISKLKKSLKKEKTKPVTFVRLCKNLDECDIDEISKIIMEMGKEKPFPDITIQ